MHRQLTQAAAALESLRGREIPLSQESISRAEEAFRAGRLSLLEVTAAQRLSLALEQTAIETAVNAQLLLLEIERLTGRAFEPSITAR